MRELAINEFLIELKRDLTPLEFERGYLFVGKDTDEEEFFHCLVERYIKAVGYYYKTYHVRGTWESRPVWKDYPPLPLTGYGTKKGKLLILARECTWINPDNKRYYLRSITELGVSQLRNSGPLC